MDIWISRCNKTVRCAYCLEDITIGEPSVFGKLWQRKTADGIEPRRWAVNFRWHARRSRDGQCCWLIKGLEEFSLHPYVERRGRKKLLLPSDVQIKRLRLLRRRARLTQQLKQLMLSELDNTDIDRFITIGSQLEQLKEEIEPYGGVPKSWL